MGITLQIKIYRFSAYFELYMATYSYDLKQFLALTRSIAYNKLQREIAGYGTDRIFIPATGVRLPQEM